MKGNECMINIKMIILKIFFIPIWLFVVFFCILMYLYDIAAGNKVRQLFKDLILELLEYWSLTNDDR